MNKLSSILQPASLFCLLGLAQQSNSWVGKPSPLAVAANGLATNNVRPALRAANVPAARQPRTASPLRAAYR